MHIELKWSEPEVPNGVIEKYQITYTNQDVPGETESLETVSNYYI